MKNPSHTKRSLQNRIFRMDLFFVILVLSLTSANASAECLIKKAVHWKMDTFDNLMLVEEIRGLRHEICLSEPDENSEYLTCPQLIADGRYGAGLQFVDGTGLNIEINDFFEWSSTDSFSIEFWMLRNGEGLLENEVILGRDDPNTKLHWWIGVEPRHGGNATAWFKDQNGELGYCRGAKSLTNSKWHHIVFVRDGKLSKNYLYVDSVLESQVQFAYSLEDAFKSRDAKLNIGWLSLDRKYDYKGKLDEVAFYTKALPQWYIRQRYYAMERFGAPCE